MAENDDLSIDFKSGDRTHFGEIAPRITGTMSAVTSLLIIILVARSTTKLGSTFHRIMIGMSLSDILSSTAMAFTTLPMPRPGLSEAVDNYDYDGLRLGNTFTCTVQGFSFATGFFGTYAYTVALCIYFASAIFFKLKMKTISRCLEPLLHLMVLTAVLSISVPPLFQQNYNPVEAWCNIGKIMMECNEGQLY